MEKGKVFIAGGGTGGHFYPALSLAEKLYNEGYQILFLGGERGIEAVENFPYGEKLLFDISAVRGKDIKSKINSIYRLLKSSQKVKKLIKEEKPIFSIVFGGYTAVPLGLASFFSRTPLFIHEQNSIPSSSNQLLSKFSKKIFYTFDYTQKFFRKKSIKSGIPLRKKIKERLSLSKQEARSILNLSQEDKIILILGGSQGAKIFEDVTWRLSKELKDFKFILIRGKNIKRDFFEKNVITYDYLQDIGLVYKASDLVISRAGASTVNELIAYGKYAIYIPYRLATSDHQYYNVRWLADKGLSKVIREEDLSIERLKANINEFFKKNPEDIQTKLKSYAILNSEEIILREIENVIFKKD
ncbi:MAG: undecaprenyldiphospho-muramoylpentapeptide beta-N-acetylglucosaminyltransferase [Aquificae bacterium]|nr:undecaprenyldiphospho-muramoylpentapeptide beta-N-acetylglucosaminyltransferase [Aquificota bacterium]